MRGATHAVLLLLRALGLLVLLARLLALVSAGHDVCEAELGPGFDLGWVVC
jgi:hypothetical protein